MDLRDKQDLSALEFMVCWVPPCLTLLRCRFGLRHIAHEYELDRAPAIRMHIPPLSGQPPRPKDHRSALCALIAHLLPRPIPLHLIAMVNGWLHPQIAHRILPILAMPRRPDSLPLHGQKVRVFMEQGLPKSRRLNQKGCAENDSPIPVVGDASSHPKLLPDQLGHVTEGEALTRLGQNFLG